MRTKKKFWSGRLNLLVAFAIGAIWSAGVTGHRAWKYHQEASAEQVAEQYNEVAKQALAGHEQSVRVLEEKFKFGNDVKLHPERYRCEFEKTYYPENGMAWAKGQQNIDAAYNGDILACNLEDGFVTSGFSSMSPVGTISVASLGASVSLVDVPNDPPIVYAYTDEPKVPTDPPNPEWRGYYRIYRATVTAPGSTDTVDIAVWLADGMGMEVNELPTGIPVVYDDTELSVTWSFGLTGAFRRATITSSYPSDQRLRHPAQQTGESRWFADVDTVVNVTASVAGQSLSASGNFGATGETDLTANVLLGLNCTIAYNYAPVVDTAYGEIRAYMGSGTSAPIDFAGWSFYQDTDNAAWHWHGSGDDPPAAANINWYTDPSASSVSLKRGANALSNVAISWSELGFGAAVKVVPTLYKANRESYFTEGGAGIERYTTYDTSEGHPFELALYKQTGQTAADVSVAPSWEGYTYVEFWSFGVPIPDRVWRKFANMGNGVSCWLRADWMIANNEDVVFTLPTTTKNVPRVEDETTYPLVDIIIPCVWHPLDGQDTLGVPWRNDWVTWAREELNLDKPNGTNRPSAWEASTGAAIDGELITVSASGGSFYRNFKSRRPNRIRRMNAHLWTGSGDQQEVSHYWLIMTRHDLSIATTGDDPKWHNPALTPWPGDDPGILYEDVTDWRGLSAVQLAVSGATEDQIVTLRIRNYHLTGSDPNYIGALYNFGSEGEFEATWSDENILDVPGTLYASTGTVLFDIAPDSGGNAPNLEYVSQIEFIFPETSAEQSLQFVSFATVPAVGVGTDFVTNRISHLHKTDFFGGRLYVDGIWNYAPTYLYDTDIERGEVGFKHTQPQKHNPDYEGPPDDPTYLKSLAEYVNEVLWSETLLRPTWDQATIDASLKDSDGNVLGTPLFSDLDENGFALRVGVWKEVSSPNMSVCYCDCILQGSARGVMKLNGVRADSASSVSLYYSDDNGLTKALVRTSTVDVDGSYVVWAGREKTPRIFYLLIDGTYYRLGSFYNQEEVWRGGAALTLADLYLYINKFGNFYRVFETSGNVKLRASYGMKAVQSAVTVGSVVKNVVNVYCWNQGQKLVVGAQQDDGTEILWVSENEQAGPFVEVT